MQCTARAAIAVITAQSNGRLQLLHSCCDAAAGVFEMKSKKGNKPVVKNFKPVDNVLVFKQLNNKRKYYDPLPVGSTVKKSVLENKIVVRRESFRIKNILAAKILKNNDNDTLKKGFSPKKKNPTPNKVTKKPNKRTKTKKKNTPAQRKNRQNKKKPTDTREQSKLCKSVINNPDECKNNASLKKLFEKTKPENEDLVKNPKFTIVFKQLNNKRKYYDPLPVGSTVKKSVLENKIVVRRESLRIKNILAAKILKNNDNDTLKKGFSPKKKNPTPNKVTKKPDKRTETKKKNTPAQRKNRQIKKKPTDTREQSKLCKSVINNPDECKNNASLKKLFEKTKPETEDLVKNPKFTETIIGKSKSLTKNSESLKSVFTKGSLEKQNLPRNLASENKPVDNIKLVDKSLLEIILQDQEKLESRSICVNTMAVKKHGLVTDSHNQLDLQALAQYIQLINEQNGYLPSAGELVKNCQDIVKCLARSTGNEERRWEILQLIEEFLLRVVNTVDHEARTDIVSGVIDKFYAYISDPQSNADAATCIVLVVLDTTSVESLMSTARWMVQQGENGPACAGLRSSLSCLYAWLSDSQGEWQGTPVLADWVMSFIKALEESERFDILIEVSVDNLDRLFSAMDKPWALRQSNADVIFHVLASLRQSNDAFDKIALHVGHVLTNLASDSGQFSRQLLQNVVDILTAMVDHLFKKTRGGARVAFKDKYGEVMQCLERHMSSRGCQQLKTAPWPARKVPPRDLIAVNPPAPAERKVGLLNLGNTCYMNSVMQALLVTRRFSTHVMLHMTNHPYWAIAAMLFGKLVHSVCTKLDSHDFFETMRPPFFTSNNQHDSSEFLGYLFELLQSFEHMSDENYDYSKPPVLSTANRWRSAIQSYTPPSSSDNEAAGSGSNRRSVSPRPGGSGGSGSSGIKRQSATELESFPKKRTRSSELPSFRRDSFIDSIFAGVLLTRLECVQCHSISLSRDVFRDLQLAFPEKTDGWQHSVQNLLEFYCSQERLSGDNQYRCRDCGVLRDAERSVIIENIPNHLILVLKNFKFEAKHQVQSKLIHNMYYNPTITLPTVRAQATHGSYSLYAAVVHSGSTLDSGHYYTIAKDGGAWFKYNDDEVTEAQESHINELEKFSTPYLLFYRRDDTDEDTAPALEDLPPKILEHVLAHNKQYIDSLRP